MKKILTALQNEKVNKKLSEYETIKIMANDIQYQEGIIETLEIDCNIDFIIFSELLPGEMKLEELIEKIKQKNETIKMILILENKKPELEKYLLTKGNIFIFYNNEITIEQLIKVIEEKTNQELLEQELLEIKKIIHKEKSNFLQEENIEEKDKDKNYFLTKQQKEEIEKEIEEEFQKNKVINKIQDLIHQKEKNKMAQAILIMGLRGCGKTVFTINLAEQLKNKKVLIIELNSKNQDIAFLKNKKKKLYHKKRNRIENNNKEEYYMDYIDKSNEIKNNTENSKQIISLGKQLDLFSKNNETTDTIKTIKQIKKWKETYDVILIDIEEIKNYESILIEEIDNIIFLTEANILQIKKSIQHLEELISKYKIEKEKINIIFHKIKKESLSLNILKNTLKEYNFLGKVNDIENCNVLINHNMRSIFLDKKIIRQYQKIGNEILKNKKRKDYYLNKINND